MVDLSALLDLALAKLGERYDSAQRFRGEIPPADGVWRSAQNTKKGAAQILAVRAGDEITHVRRFSGGHRLEVAIWFVDPGGRNPSLSLSRDRLSPRAIHAFTATGSEIPLDQLTAGVLSRIGQILMSI